MKLGVRWLDQFSGANAWIYGPVPSFDEGDSQVLYLQLWDEQAQCGVPGGNSGLYPGLNVGRRYLPAAGATLTLVFDSVDDAKKVTRVLAQPVAADDRSIWRVDVTPADPIRGSVTLRFTLNESGAIHTAIVRAGLSVGSTQRI